MIRSTPLLQFFAATHNDPLRIAGNIVFVDKVYDIVRIDKLRLLKGIKRMKIAYDLLVFEHFYKDRAIFKWVYEDQDEKQEGMLYNSSWKLTELIAYTVISSALRMSNTFLV